MNKSIITITGIALVMLSSVSLQSAHDYYGYYHAEPYVEKRAPHYEYYGYYQSKPYVERKDPHYDYYGYYHSAHEQDREFPSYYAHQGQEAEKSIMQKWLDVAKSLFFGEKMFEEQINERAQ